METLKHYSMLEVTHFKFVLYFQSGRIGADEEIDEFKGMSEQEVQELMEEREAKANAQILAMVMHMLCSLISHCRDRNFILSYIEFYTNFHILYSCHNSTLLWSK